MTEQQKMELVKALAYGEMPERAAAAVTTATGIIISSRSAAPAKKQASISTAGRSSLL